LLPDTLQTLSFVFPIVDSAPRIRVNHGVPGFYLTWKEALFLFPLKGTDGSLKFPDYPFENMPRSQLQTPVVSYKLTITSIRLLPSVLLNAVGFLPMYRNYPYDHNYTYFGAQ
jgi:hypothetical protein